MKTALIGAGNMGRNHARVYSEISEFVAVADPAMESGRALASLHRAKYYPDYRKMLDTEKPKAVTVAVPTHLHTEVAIECLKRRIAVLVEKPLSDSVAKASEIVDTARENNTVLMTGHIERFNPAIIHLKKLISDGRLGSITSLLAVRVGIAPPKTGNADVVLDLAIHDVDVSNFLLGQLPVSSRVVRHRIFNANIADSGTVFLDYKSASAVAQTNWITPIKRRQLYVTGTDAFVEVDYINQKISLYNKIVDKIKTGDYYNFVALTNQAPVEEIYTGHEEPLKLELCAFLKAVKSKSHIDNLYAVEALKIVTNGQD